MLKVFMLRKEKKEKKLNLLFMIIICLAFLLCILLCDESHTIAYSMYLHVCSDVWNICLEDKLYYRSRRKKCQSFSYPPTDPQKANVVI